MKTRLSFIFIFCISFNAYAQNDNRLAQGVGPISRVEKIILPTLDNDKLLQKEMERRQPGLAPRFAESMEVNISPTTHGTWEKGKNGKLVWRLLIRSKNAKSLNLGFTKYKMPEGGSLILYSPDFQHILGPFTPADNETHEQLWTPVIPGDEIVIELQILETTSADLELKLKYVNHDFLGFGAVASGSCNIDVICGALEGWSQVDDYRDIIRSVAVIGTGGNTFCSGFLVNNSRNDCTPFFMTAKHCGINNTNAPTLVAYWNYENSYCREVGSPNNGILGDGTLNDFNTGAIYRASNSASDFTLLELDDPVSETANAFFAGWSTLPVAPTKAVGIHHPGGDEKRISFENDELMLTNGLNSDPDANFTHIRVIDWDLGTTEVGSSGSPLFDQNKRVVGQLHGGAAACSNDKSDWYGSFSKSWSGSGTSSTQLKYWLDPDDTGVTILDGREISACNVSIECNPSSVEVCSPSENTFNISTSETFESNVTLSVSTNIPGIENPTFSNNPIAPGGSTELSLSIDQSVPNGNYTINISGTDGVATVNNFIVVTVYKTIPNALELITPTNEEIFTSIIPRFRWESGSPETIYELQIATDIDFNNIVETVTDLDTNFYDNITLDVLTDYFWRVRGANLCGNGAWSEISSFSTADIHCLTNSSFDIPITIPHENVSTKVSTIEILDNGLITDLNVNSLDIYHTWVGDLIVTLESPSGKTVTLFDRPGVPASNFGCPEDNLLLDFDDDAIEDYGTFDATCNEGDMAISGSFQPLESLKTFNGDPAAGIWTLTIIDMADEDGGMLNGWDLNICSTIIPDLSISSSINSPAFCLGENINFQITLGTGYGITGINLSAIGQPIGSTVEFGENNVLPGTTVDVTIQGINSVGNYPILFFADDGTNTFSSEIMIQIEGNPAEPHLMFPLNNQPGISLTPTFFWLEAENTSEYLIEVAEDESFENIIISNWQFELEYDSPELHENQTYYWRVSAINDCGTTLSPIFTFTTDLINSVKKLDHNDIKIFPNPTNGKLYIHFTQPLQDDVNIEFFSSSGKLVKQLNSNIITNEIEVDLADFSNGIYLLRIVNNESVLSRKIILQK